MGHRTRRAVVLSASTDEGLWPPEMLCIPERGLVVTTHAYPHGLPAAGKAVLCHHGTTSW